MLYGHFKMPQYYKYCRVDVNRLLAASRMSCSENRRATVPEKENKSPEPKHKLADR